MDELDDIERWLSSSIPGFQARVTPIEIPSVSPPSRRAKRQLEDFHAAFAGRASRQHGWLKWFAFNYLGYAARYEVEIYIPRTLGKRGNGKGHVLPRGHRYFSVGGDRFQRADVADYDTVIEVGFTSPYSLIEPLWCFAVSRTIWIPFQRDDIHADTDDFSIINKGYLIERPKQGKGGIKIPVVSRDSLIPCEA